MKKIALAAIILVFGQFSIQAQENLNTSAQPSNITFIHVEDLSNFSQAELDLLQVNYIVFDGELTEELVEELLATTKTSDTESEQSLKPEEQQFVKEWLGANPEIKIVTRPEYAASPENIRDEYFKSRCLILIGEIVTREDILNY